MPRLKTIQMKWFLVSPLDVRAVTCAVSVANSPRLVHKSRVPRSVAARTASFRRFGTLCTDEWWFSDGINSVWPNIDANENKWKIERNSESKETAREKKLGDEKKNYNKIFWMIKNMACIHVYCSTRNRCACVYGRMNMYMENSIKWKRRKKFTNSVWQHYVDSPSASLNSMFYTTMKDKESRWIFFLFFQLTSLHAIGQLSVYIRFINIICTTKQICEIAFGIYTACMYGTLGCKNITFSQCVCKKCATATLHFEDFCWSTCTRAVEKL